MSKIKVEITIQDENSGHKISKQITLAQTKDVKDDLDAVVKIYKEIYNEMDHYLYNEDVKYLQDSLFSKLEIPSEFLENNKSKIVEDEKYFKNYYKGIFRKYIATTPKTDSVFYQMFKDEEKYKKWINGEIEVEFSPENKLTKGEIEIFKEEFNSTLNCINGCKKTFDKAKLLQDIINNYNSADSVEKTRMMNNLKEFYK